MEEQERASPKPRGKPELQGVYKTIFLFLKNENFIASSETFKKECESLGSQIQDISGNVLLHAGKQTHSVGNQTEPSSDAVNNVNSETFTLRSSFQESSSHKVNQNIESPFTTTSTPLLPQSKHKHVEPNVKFSSTPFYMDLDFSSLKSRFGQLQDEHRKLIAVTAELTNALQLNIMGQAKNMHHVLDQCKTIYPSLFISQDHVRQSPPEAVNPGGTSSSRRSKNEFTSTTNQAENLLESHESANEESSGSTLNKQPNSNQLYLDIGYTDNEEESQLHTPVSEKEIKDILEIVLNKALQYLSQSEGNSEADCCDIGKACTACSKEITKIVESILVKVMESPRYKTSPKSSNSISNCYTTQLEPNQEKVQTTNELPQNPGADLMATYDDNANRTNNNKTQNQEAKEAILNEDINLTYDLVKNDLLKCNNEKILYILQALRWRLTKSTADERDETLDAYIQHDVLNLHEKQLWPELLPQKNCAELNEHLARLLNAFASLRNGRDYLGSNGLVLKSVLLPQFMNGHSTARERDMLAATLQKLSLQNRIRVQMVKEGLLDYLIGFLNESYNKLSLYCLEHCTALLMNLCLVDDAKTYCVDNAGKVISLLKKFLTKQHTSSLPYINGTLLSLLVHEDIYFEAKKQRLDQVVQQLIKDTQDEYLRQQLNFIIRSRFSGQLHLFIGDEDEHPQIPDILESEIDTEPDEVNVNETVMPDHKKLDNKGIFNSELDSTQARNLPKLRKETHYHIGSLSGVQVLGSDDRRSLKPSTVNSGKRKRVLRRVQHFPNSSFCYLEICNGVQGGTESCGCSKCVPGKSRYSCGCYDVIRREIAEEIDNVICAGQSHNRTKYIKKTFREGSVEVIENTTKKNHGSCAICGDKICDCAFESRPKIDRTPPKT